MLSIWSGPKFSCVGKNKALPYNKILDLSKLKEFADDEVNLTKRFKFCFRKGKQH